MSCTALVPAVPGTFCFEERDRATSPELRLVESTVVSYHCTGDVVLQRKYTEEVNMASENGPAIVDFPFKSGDVQ